MELDYQNCECKITVPVKRYNEVVDYVRALENRLQSVVYPCDTCIGCEIKDTIKHGLGTCDQWKLKYENN